MSSAINTFKQKILRFFINPFSFFDGERETVFDLLKLWALLSVILDHSLQRWIADSQNLFIYNFIFLSQMPIFFFCSGYFVFHQIKKLENFNNIEKIKYFGKKTLSFLVPFFVFSLIESIFYNDFSIMYLCVVFPQKSLWFLWCLFIIEAIMFASQLLSLLLFRKKRALYSFIFFIILLAIPLALYIVNPTFFDNKLILYYSLFFLLGYTFNYFYKKYFDKTLVFNILFLCSFLCLIIVLFFRPNIIFEDDNFTNTLVRIIGSISSIYVLFYFLNSISNIKFFSNLSKFGRLSLEFYWVHAVLFLLIPTLRYGEIGYFEFSLYYLIVVLITFVIIMILKSNYLTNFVCFGKIFQLRKRSNTSQFMNAN